MIVDIMKIEPVLLTKGMEGKRNGPLAPRTDEISVAGVFLQTSSRNLDENVRVWRQDDELRFKDGSNPKGTSLSELVAARAPSIIRLPPGNTKAGDAPLQFVDGFLNESPQHGAVEFRNGQLTIGVNGSRQPLNEGASWTGNTTTAGRQEIFLEGTQEGRLVLPDNSLFAFDAFGVGVDTTEGTVRINTMRGAIRRKTGPSSIELLLLNAERPVPVGIDVCANPMYGAMTIMVTPEARRHHCWSVRARVIKMLDLPPSS